MNEELLSWLWEFRVPALSGMYTVSGEPVDIIHPGYRNSDAGPDYHYARIRIGGREWAGQVELHVLSSDWESHGHSANPNYRNILLHVVWQHDKEPTLLAERGISTLELKPLLEKGLPEAWDTLRNNSAEIACGGKPQREDPLLLRQWLDRMACERLARKTENVHRLLNAAGGNWEEVLYRQLAYAYGLRVNSHSMEQLAKQAPLRLVNRYRGSALYLEALLFGVSGILPERSEEEYPAQLRVAFDGLKHAHGLLPMELSQWKYHRMHPAAFPDIRIARFAVLLRSINPLMSLLHLDLEETEKVFSLPPHAYWIKHFRFGHESRRLFGYGAGILGELVMVDAMVPFLHAYGKWTGNEKFLIKAMDILEWVRPARNNIVREWDALGIHAESALDSQALIEARNNYCARRKCLSCIVGKIWLKDKNAYDKKNYRIF
jgi:hypothetical protein